MTLLALLHKHGAMSAVEASAHLGLSPSQVRRQCRDLAQRGWITSTPDPEDARYTINALTVEGHAALKQKGQINGGRNIMRPVSGARAD